MVVTILAAIALLSASCLGTGHGRSGPETQVAVSAHEVSRGDPNRSWISLVFNAGAGHEPATEILDTLLAKQVRTTFFLMAWWAERHPELVRRIGQEHEVASHGHSVLDLTAVPDSKVVDDLETADRIISALIGRTTRPLWSPSAGYRDARVRTIAASLGYRPIHWTTDSGDWREDATPSLIEQRVLAGAANGAIIVLHFDSPQSRRGTAVVLPGLIDALRARGYQLVTITQLLTGR